MAGHKGLAMIYGRGRESAPEKVSGLCESGRHRNCFSVRCNCPCHNRAIEKANAKEAAKAAAAPAFRCN